MSAFAPAGPGSDIPMRALPGPMADLAVAPDLPEIIPGRRHRSGLLGACARHPTIVAGGLLLGAMLLVAVFAGGGGPGGGGRGRGWGKGWVSGVAR